MTLKGKLENEAAEAVQSASTARRPYRAPHLKRLGSVRELTLGKSNGTPEAMNTKKVN